MKVTVIGAGVWGSSTAYYLRKQGAQVQLVDMWGPGNARSGSGGASRIIRLVYGPDQLYVDLTSRSFELWAELFENNEREYYRETGLIWLFSQDDVSYALDSRKRISELGFELEEVDLHDASTAYHQISFDGVKRVFFEDKAGILFASRCCDLLLSKYMEAGGHYLQGYASVTTNHDGFLLQVNGKKVESDRYVFACGPWTRKLFPDLLQECTYVSKHDVYHFAIPAQKLRLFDYHHLPVWLEYDPLSPLYYGMPMHLGKGFKIAYDDRSDQFDPDTDDRLLNSERLKSAREFVHRRFPLLKEAPISYTEVCQYDNSIDGHFIVDHHNRFPEVLLMTGSSGHGFKMGPALGELVAKHLLKGTGLSEKFRLSRFSDHTKKQTQFLPY